MHLIDLKIDDMPDCIVDVGYPATLRIYGYVPGKVFIINIPVKINVW